MITSYFLFSSFHIMQILCQMLFGSQGGRFLKKLPPLPPPAKTFYNTDLEQVVQTSQNKPAVQNKSFCPAFYKKRVAEGKNYQIR